MRFYLSRRLPSFIVSSISPTAISAHRFERIPTTSTREDMHNLFVTMADRNITLIKDLDNMKDDYTLKVSIIRLWRSLSDVNPIIFKSIEMILMDEMCTKIRASVYPRDFQRFESKLKEDQAVYIRSPTIPPNRYSFKISDVTSKLNLNGRTTVNECLHIQSKTTYGFSCVSFERIISATTTSNDSIGNLDSRDVSKSRHRLPLQIRNLEGLQVNVTLFGDIAYQLISYLEAHKQVGRVIVLLQFAKINVYNGLPSVNSYFEHTRMFINVDLPDIVTFLVGLLGLQNPSSSLTVDSSQSYSEYDDFLNNHNVKNVVDLLEPQEEGKFIIVGTFMVFDKILIGTMMRVQIVERKLMQGMCSAVQKVVMQVWFMNAILISV
ncbi:unnamed protein product [Lactuca virosa]|uniref:Replication protein A 70 kDa DNA-binding subunit B/D first OB fold domain-containing protein n=1 Tax=Lactuca virosa TaxID=75947 RepID=A0AAU9MVD2_9ASTR|nr:unnamed protein product [Lactuca virosa]